MEDVEAKAWRNAEEQDLWIFDKLIVSRRMGYTCGPAGMDVPRPDVYVVRPCVNIPGMGKGAYFTYIDKESSHLPPGSFWCKKFYGRHISVDYKDGRQVLAVEGFRDDGAPFWRFSKWVKIDDVIPMPSMLYDISKRYETINVEYIDDNLIEVHLRGNPDFIYDNSVMYPMWNDQKLSDFPFIAAEKLRLVNAVEYNRQGIWVDKQS